MKASALTTHLGFTLGEEKNFFNFFFKLSTLSSPPFNNVNQKRISQIFKYGVFLAQISLLS